MTGRFKGVWRFMAMDMLTYRMHCCIEYINLCAQIKEVPGFLLDIQGYALHLLAREGPGLGAIVEIGSFKGRSTCWLALGAKAAGRERVTAIDHFKGSEEHQVGERHEDPAIRESGTTLHEFKLNIRRLEVADHINTIDAPSEEAAKDWTKPIRLLFIDGDHSYEASRRDFECWSPFVVSEGLIVFHDIGDFEGVTEFYRKLLATGAYQEVIAVGSLCVISKKSP